MTKIIGRNRNVNDEATVNSPILLNSATATKLADANPNRLFFHVSVIPGALDKGVFIRLYPTANDNTARGIWIGRFDFVKTTFFQASWSMPTDNIYTGEISAILGAGDLPENVYVTEY